ncbi:MAG TPA: bifunctional UDP-sugar hydrolase/5'-nucleotidase [Opitutaceae bacterium]|nr:bifunctional UDP-sugar hydrolase/5'-nucleotidase [Opitutaceae bacterium]
MIRSLRLARSTAEPRLGRRHFLLLSLALGIAVLAGRSLAAEQVRVTILATTDLHGHIDPIDYYTNRPDQDGLAKVATIVKQARAENPHLLLLDSGDTIQGTPLAYFHNRKHNEPPDPTMLAMNAIGYDAMTLGNHEYNFGLAVLQKARSEAKFPWLSANTYRVGTDETAFPPYLVKDVDGVRVGILGLTTPSIPNWEDAANFAGLEFRDPVTEAKKWVAVLRDREHVDLVVLTVHFGLAYDLATGAVPPGQFPHENDALAIAQQVPGIDLILMGHTHREVPALVVNGVLLAQAEKWGYRVVRAEIYCERNPAGRWQVVAKASRTIPVTEKIAADPEIVRLAEPYDRETQVWLAQPIGACAHELTAADSRLRDNALLDLVQRVQLEAGHADVSMVASFNLAARIPQGPVAVREVYGLYYYENTLVVVELTGRQVKDALEHSAHYFRPYEPGRTPAELIDDKIPGYHFDIAEGVTYEIDLTRPFGERIVNLRFQGQPLDPERKLRVAINNYRQNGGGGYTMYKNAPVVYRSSAEIRDLIIDWVERHHDIPTEPTNNWRILPTP